MTEQRSYVAVVKAKVFAGVGKTQVRRAAPRVNDGQGDRQQASSQQIALLVEGRELHHGLH